MNSINRKPNPNRVSYRCLASLLSCLIFIYFLPVPVTEVPLFADQLPAAHGRLRPEKSVMLESASGVKPVKIESVDASIENVVPRKGTRVTFKAQFDSTESAEIVRVIVKVFSESGLKKYAVLKKTEQPDQYAISKWFKQVAPDENYTYTIRAVYSETGKKRKGNVEQTMPFLINNPAEKENRAPVAQDTVVTGDEDQPVSGQVVGTDADNNPLTYGLVQTVDAEKGNLAFDTGGTFTFTPAANFNGAASFMYKANDGKADSNISTVTLNVNPVPDMNLAISNITHESAQLHMESDQPVTTTLEMQNPDGTWQVQAASSEPLMSDDFNLLNLDASTAYKVRIRATDERGIETLAEEIAFDTAALPPVPAPDPKPDPQPAPDPGPEPDPTLPPIPANAIYVDAVNGNDANDGSELQALLTLEKALLLATDGVTIVLTGGAYSQTQTLQVRQNNLTIRALDSRMQSILTNKGKGPILDVYGSNFTLDGIGQTTAEDGTPRYGIVIDSEFRGYDPALEGPGGNLGGTLKGERGIVIRGANVTLRNFEAGNSTQHLIDFRTTATGALVENFYVHDALVFNPVGVKTKTGRIDYRVDAHLIVSDASNGTFRNGLMKNASGDSFQFGSSRPGAGVTNIVIENIVASNGPLAVDTAGYKKGAYPGENFMDTKQGFNAPRGSMSISNVVASGFQSQYIANGAAFNIKEDWDVFMDRITVFDSDIAFRLRGRDSEGYAYWKITNALVYDVKRAFRLEDYDKAEHTQNIHLLNSTVGANVTQVFQIINPIVGDFDAKNLLILDNGQTLSKYVNDPSNKIVSADVFVDAAKDDYHLASTAANLIDAGVTPSVENFPEEDRDGKKRIVGDAIDIGAFEFQPANQAPAIAAVPDIILSHDTPNVVNLDITDPDGDTSIPSLKNAPAFVSLNFDNTTSKWQLVFNHTEEDDGKTYVFNISVTDADGLSSEITVNVTCECEEAPAPMPMPVPNPVPNPAPNPMPNPMPNMPADGPVIVTHAGEIIPNFGYNPTVTAMKSGNWSDMDLWMDTTTGLMRGIQDGDVVAIGNGMEVIYDVVSDVRLNTVSIEAGGTLKFKTDADTKMVVTNLLVHEGGALIIGDVNQPIADSVHAEVIIADTPIDPINDPKQFGTGIIGLGTVHIHGRKLEETFVNPAAELLAGATSLKLNSAIAGWKVGDELYIPDTRQGVGTKDTQFEIVTISAISADGLEITFDSPLLYNHRGPRNPDGMPVALPDGSIAGAHVVNLTRNVIIRSENPDETTGTRGHTLFTGRADIDIRYASFKDLGRTLVGQLDSTTFNADGTVASFGTNHIGRYALHLHHVMGRENPSNTGYQFTLVGNELEGIKKWGYVVHNSHYGLIADNVGLGNRNPNFAAPRMQDSVPSGNYQGDMFAFEGSPSKIDLWNNFVGQMQVNGDPQYEDWSSDLGGHGSAFWFMNPSYQFNIEGNVAASFTNAANAAGFTYFVNNHPLYPRQNQVQIPIARGSEIMMTVDFTKEPFTLGSLTGSSNQVYGMGEGIQIWSTGKEDASHNDTVDIGPEVNTIVNFAGWHLNAAGIDSIHMGNGLKVDRVVLVNDLKQRSLGVNSGLSFIEMYSFGVTIENSTIEGFKKGVTTPTITQPFAQTGWGLPFVMRNNFFSNETDVYIRAPYSDKPQPLGSHPEFLSPVDIFMEGNSHIRPQSLSSRKTYTTIDMDARTLHNTFYDPKGVGNALVPVRVRVFDMNGLEQNDFQIYFNEQHPDFVLPTSGIFFVGSPEEGITNLELKNKYGLEPYGAVAPCGYDAYAACPVAQTLAKSLGISSALVFQITSETT